MILPRRSALCFCFLVTFAAIAVAPPLQAQQLTLDFDPHHTQVEFTLGADFHTVHGTFALERGSIHFDSAAHKADGLIVVDAASGNSNNATRDRRMHREVLESDKYSEISFAPDRFDGQIPASGDFQLSVHGNFHIHGSDHDMILPVQATRDPNGITANLQFAIPYIRWGLKNPSTFFLRVSEQVNITIHTVVSITPVVPRK
jgi:polyisoprenoid-binding protein YceI